ncbi:hypothetical protein GQE99_18610 [Maritimibacter sp. DP07]|uniref:Uncharacterized protein n=1 Tax=Maritimibacter harenae TaxID=2606218 RepID=A0A845M640_9RHOB|nr:hypothetical protein [Maritimibacter harenae]MZR15036.1 hypothetical protein [Maritimibacter harenae]
MLVMTPAARKSQRRKERRALEARRGKLGRTRYDALVKELADVIRLAFDAGATASLWGMEGPLRAGIRADLCLQGWSWGTADLTACDMLAEAFRRVRAVRPTWNEGQPEWVIHEGLLIERTRCVRCSAPLPEGHHKFCGKACSMAMHHYIASLKAANEQTAVRLAVNSKRKTS